MNALAIGGVVFAFVFGGALAGMFLSAVLPKHHLSADSKDVIKVAMAMIATLAALVIGLLIASAKGFFDSKDAELRRSAAQSVVLDRMMAEYGPEAREIRDLIRQTIAVRIRQIWPEQAKAKVNPGAFAQGPGVEAIQRKLLDLSPQDDAQRWLRSTALEASRDILETRWLAVEQIGTSIQWPFLVTMVFWLAVIFTSFGLFAPRNGSVIAALFVCALSVAGAVYLIIEMDQPYGGLIKLSSTPLMDALDQMGQP